MHFPIEVHQLSKHIAKQTIVQQLTFRVKKGQILGFLGPNGAGKTTTMKIIAGCIRPTQGSVQIRGHHIDKQPRQAKSNIGYLPEHNPLYSDMYVYEYLQFMGRTRGLKSKQCKERVQRVVEDCGLSELSHRKLLTLSKGYRQRVGLAQALVHDPAVLVLDEPTAGLDPNQLGEIRELIQKISVDKAVILSTHVMQEVETMCSHVLIINHGQVVIQDSLANIQHEQPLVVEFKEPIQSTMLEEISGIKNIKALSKCRYILDPSQGQDIREALFRFAQANALTLLVLEQQKSPLEEIFRKLTGPV